MASRKIQNEDEITTSLLKEDGPDFRLAFDQSASNPNPWLGRKVENAGTCNPQV